jgi:hypothetical protein
MYFLAVGVSMGHRRCNDYMFIVSLLGLGYCIFPTAGINLYTCIVFFYDAPHERLYYQVVNFHLPHHHNLVVLLLFPLPLISFYYYYCYHLHNHPL